MWRVPPRTPQYAGSRSSGPRGDHVRGLERPRDTAVILRVPTIRNRDGRVPDRVATRTRRPAQRRRPPSRYGGWGPRHGRSWVAAQGWALAVEPQAWGGP